MNLEILRLSDNFGIITSSNEGEKSQNLGKFVKIMRYKAKIVKVKSQYLEAVRFSGKYVKISRQKVKF